MNNTFSFLHFCLLPTSSPWLTSPCIPLPRLYAACQDSVKEPDLGPTVTKEGRWRGDVSSSHVQGTSPDTGGKDIDDPLDTCCLIILHNGVNCPCFTQNTRLPQFIPNSPFQPQSSPLLLQPCKLEPRTNSRSWLFTWSWPTSENVGQRWTWIQHYYLQTGDLDKWVNFLTSLDICLLIA